MTALFYASLLALWGLVLALRVIRGRHNLGISLGDGGVPMMERRQRAFGNFAEYVPLILIPLVLIDLLGGPVWAIHLVGAQLVVGRVFHGIALGFGAHWGFGRIFGMVLTLSALTCGGVIGLAMSLGGLPSLK